MENYVFDCKHVISGQLLAGVDEAGRGPLAGPVVAAAVIQIGRASCRERV